MYQDAVLSILSSTGWRMHLIITWWQASNNLIATSHSTPYSRLEHVLITYKRHHTAEEVHRHYVKKVPAISGEGCGCVDKVRVGVLDGEFVLIFLSFGGARPLSCMARS
jgi:hypothetical protein